MKITQIIAFAGAIAFILTVVYIYGFSRIIEVNLLTYFSINDYIKFSVYWLPGYIFTFFIGYGLNAFEPSFLRIGISEDEIAKHPNISAYNKFLLKHESMILGSMGIATIGIIIYLAFHFAPKQALHICFCFFVISLWMSFFNFLLLPRLPEKWTHWQNEALFIGPPIIIAVYVYSLFAGVSELDIVDKHPTARLEMTSEASNKKGRVSFCPVTIYCVFRTKN